MIPVSKADNIMPLEMSWDGYDFNRWLTALQTSVNVAANKTALHFSEKYRDNVVLAILRQQFNLPELSRRYLKMKAQSGLDTRILMATGRYLDTIKVWKWRRGKQDVYVVGVPPAATYKRAGGAPVKVADVARWLENGTRTMPARPVWYLTLEQMLDQSKTFKDWYDRQLRKTMAREEKKARARGRKVRTQ
jgi:hypothetical protein